MWYAGQLANAAWIGARSVPECRDSTQPGVNLIRSFRLSAAVVTAAFGLHTSPRPQGKGGFEDGISQPMRDGIGLANQLARICACAYCRRPTIDMVAPPAPLSATRKGVRMKFGRWLRASTSVSGREYLFPLARRSASSAAQALLGGMQHLRAEVDVRIVFWTARTRCPGDDAHCECRGQ